MQQEEQKPSVTMLDHIDDLRFVLLRCFFALIVGCVIVAAFFPYFADFLNYPLRKALGSNQDLIQGLVTTSPMGVFSVLFQVCFLGGLAIAFPYMLYCAATFVLPGLNEKERGLLVPGCLAVFVLFVTGALFSYYLVLPTSLAVSIEFNQMFGFQLIWSAPEYYGLVVWMTLGIGFCFEFPLAIILLVYLDLITVAKLASLRRHMVVVVLVVSAIITPGGDPLTLAILAVPMYFLYEMALWVGKRIEVRRLRTAEAPGV